MADYKDLEEQLRLFKQLSQIYPPEVINPKTEYKPSEQIFEGASGPGGIFGMNSRLISGDYTAPIESSKVDEKLGIIPPSSPREAANRVLTTGPSDRINTLANLEKSQAAREDSVLANKLGQAGELIGSAISRTKPIAQGLFQQNIKDADKIVTDFEARADKEKDDPNSSISKQAREFMKKFDTQLSPDVSFNDIQKIAPFALRGFEAEENRKARLEEVKLRSEALKFSKEQALQAKTDAQKDKDIASYRKEVTTGERGKIYANYMTAQRARSALNEFSRDPNGYTDYATLMSGLKTLQGDQSVVREAEIRMGKNAASLFQKVENAIASALTGKQLQPEQRENIIKAVGTLADISKEQYKTSTKGVYNQAKRKGLPIEEIFDDPNLHQDEVNAVGLDAKTEALVKHFMQQNPKIKSQSEAMDILRQTGYIK